MATDATNDQSDTGRWGRIPAWWLGHPDIDADGLAVLAALATFANDRGECWPSQTRLATALKRSRSTVNRILARLANADMIEIQTRTSSNGGRLSCLYRLRLAPDTEKSDTTGPHPHGADADGDRSVAATDSPCSPMRQKQSHSKQKPDSPADRANAREVPPDWTPDANDLAWAKTRFRNVDLTPHIELFLLRCQAHGYRYRDIGAAWRSWLIQDMTTNNRPAAEGPAAAPSRYPQHTTQTRAGQNHADPSRPGQDRSSQTAAEQRANAWAAAANRLNTRPNTDSIVAVQP